MPTSLIHPKKILLCENDIQVIETVFVPRLRVDKSSPLLKSKIFITVPFSDDVAKIVPLLLIEIQAKLDS